MYLLANAVNSNQYDEFSDDGISGFSNTTKVPTTKFLTTKFPPPDFDQFYAYPTGQYRFRRSET